MSPSSQSRALILSRSAVVAGLAVAFLLVLGTTLLTAWSTRGVVQENARVARTGQILAAATRLQTTAFEASLATRRYLATRDEKFRATFTAMRARHNQDIAALRRQFELDDDFTTAPVFTELKRVAAAHFADLATVIDSAARLPLSPAPMTGGSDDDLHALDDFRRLVTALQADDFAALAEHAAFTADRAERIRVLNLALVVSAGALATGAAWWLLRRVRDLETLITVCAWTRRVQWEGRWVSFEEYLSRRFHLRFTHGICDEAAEHMRADAAKLQRIELRRTRRDVPVPFAGGHSTAPFA